MDRQHHVQYASTSHIEQVFHELYGEISEVDLQSSDAISSSVKGKLSAVVGSLSGQVDGSQSQSRIKRINFDNEMTKTKRVINDLLNDESIPHISELSAWESNWKELYRFSTPLQLQPTEGEFDDDHDFVRVTGIKDGVKFHGMTSLDNWGSRSDLLSALNYDEPYPFQGVLRPKKREYSGIEQEEYSVDYLFICSPDKEARQRWSERKQLIDELYK